MNKTAWRLCWISRWWNTVLNCFSGLLCFLILFRPFHSHNLVSTKHTRLEPTKLPTPEFHFSFQLSNRIFFFFLFHFFPHKLVSFLRLLICKLIVQRSFHLRILFLFFFFVNLLTWINNKKYIERIKDNIENWLENKIPDAN